MRGITRRTVGKKKLAEMKRPSYKFCSFCDRKVGRKETTCPASGRLTVRNLRAVGKLELMEGGGEPYFCSQERRKENRILFEKMTEESDPGLAVETMF